MSRTTPPRPVDLLALFPELAAHVRTTTRLHPRPGAPEPTGSSVGGPLLWPADEEWPICREDHDVHDARRPDDARLRRRVLSAASSRTPRGERVRFTERERADLARADREIVLGVELPPLPMMAVAQLFARDVPDLACPDGADLLQVLWCPFDHLGGVPAVVLRWRRAADVVDVLADQPEPPVMESDYYLPEPCVLHPERVVEYEYLTLLPEKLERRIREWEESAGHSYDHLSIAAGWKAGGWPWWTITDPYPMTCECGEDMRLLLTVASSEWYGDDVWRPIEDDPALGVAKASRPTMITIGRGYSLWIFICPRSYDHPHALSMQ
ncbi:hypothetical protein FDA94_33540 [Herbidospora galbida]|uniref:DUF1963 domain-containing protein n=1 Tax=Herbidospora galbida TaxID=2575442 RepID=A0A4U3M0C8_9ACTN|nr:hypothetical protein [Herbidospora galbida]TKK81194.1 hypothetical protein FDA94_33540 [Herbidospora galbida]